MRKSFAVAAAACLVLAGAVPALAGGWAVTTLDEVPERFEAGATYTLGYTILQHGRTPVAVDGSGIRITTGEERVTFPGVPDGPIGHYVAEVSFPVAGTWTWEVDQGGFAPYPLGTVDVTPRASAATAFLAGILRAALPVGALLAVGFLLWTALRAARPIPEAGVDGP